MIVVGLAALWWHAVAVWPGLPPRIPTHFGLDGRPDAFAATSAWTWFGLPALATAMGLGLGLGLPSLARRLAERNSPWLNVPERRLFAALPVDARLRALAPFERGMLLIALAVLLLCALLQHAIAEIAAGRLAALPSAPFWLLLAALLATPIAMVWSATRAVRREHARHARGASTTTE